MKSEIKKGAFLSYVLLIVSNVIALIYTPFMIQRLGQSEYGLYSLVNSIIGYLTILDLGFGNAIVIYTAKYREQNNKTAEQKLHGMFFVIFIILGLMAGLLGFLLFLNADYFFGGSMTNAELEKAKILLLILTFNLAITFPFSIYSSIITAYEKFTFQKVMALFRTIINPFIMIPLLLMGFKSVSMVCVVTFLNIVTLFCNYWYCKKKLYIKITYQGIDKKLLKEISIYSFFIFLNVIIDKVNWSVDQFILGSVSGTIAVSLYALASQFNNMYLNFSTAISGIMLPKITRMVARKASEEEITNEFIKTGRVQYYLLFMIITGFILFGKEFIILWAGKEYETSYFIALILMIPVTIPLIQNVGISILQAKNLHKFRSVLYFFIAIVNLVISIPLAKMYGGIGSAIGTSLSLIVGNIIIINIYYHKKAKLNMIIFWKNICEITIKQIVPLALILIFLIFMPLKGILNLLIYIPLYVIIYCTYTYLLVMNNYEKDLFMVPIKKIVGKVCHGKSTR